MVELNPQIGRQLKLVLKSTVYYCGMIAYHPQLDQKSRAIITENLIDLAHDPEGKQILTLFKCERIVPFQEKTHLNALRELYQAHANLGKAMPAHHADH